MAMRMRVPLTSTVNDNPAKKSRVGRNVKVLSSSLSIDEEDYIVVREMFSIAGTPEYEMNSKIASKVKVQENDKERRVVSIGYFDRIQSLPTCIGKLEALTDLHLSYRLMDLPEEIGNLHSLKVLKCDSSGIKELPASIGKLQNLTNLTLRSTRSLKSLPEEIGNLTNLEELNLTLSGITALPTSIGNLQNLQKLTLIGTSWLSNLPMEIVNLIGLTRLSLLSIVLVPLPVKEKIASALLCNKALAKTDLGIARGEKKLWPLVLGNAQACFGLKRIDLEIELFERKCDLGYELFETVTAELKKHDAVYLLLRLRREEFIQLLIDRQKHWKYPK